MTRILSAFNLLKRVGFAVLLLGTANAQPQAPIEWGQIQLLQALPDTLGPLNIVAKGDTIVLFSVRLTGVWEGYPAVSISVDGGVNWNPWYVFWEAEETSALVTSAGFTSDGIYCCLDTPSGRQGLYKTTDLGLSWDPPVQSQVLMRIQDTIGDTIVCTSSTTDGRFITWTANGGQTFAQLRAASTLDSRGDYRASVGQGLIHFAEISSITGIGQHANYCTGPLTQGPFEPLVDVSSNFVAAYTLDVDFDQSGNGVLASVVAFNDGLHPGAVIVQSTHDNGASWSQPDTVNPIQSADPFTIIVDHNERNWVAYWADTLHDGDVHPRGGGWTVFSANAGKSWYPRQQAYSDSVYGGDIFDVNVERDHVDIYALFYYWNGVRQGRFFKWTGEIRRDTLAPEYGQVSQLPGQLPMDTAVFFHCQATDIDSLWQVSVVLRCEGCEDSTILPLARAGDDQYSNPWETGHESHEWTYYYRAEDMWGNVAFCPTAGPNEPWRVRVGTQSGVLSAVPLLPRENSVTIAPNPANGSVRISLAYSNESPTAVLIYDLLGRERNRISLPNTTRNGTQLSWNTCDAAGYPLSTGLYFVTTEPRNLGIINKVLIIR